MVSIRGRRNRHGSGGSTSAAVEPSLPEGWSLADHVNPDGEVVKCYTNVIGQKFFTMEDLQRYVRYAKTEKISIYKRDFDSSDLADTGSEDSDVEYLGSTQVAEKTNVLNQASTSNPHEDSKPRKQGGEVTGRRRLRSNTQFSDHVSAVDENVDDKPTSSKKGKGIAKSSKTKPPPLRASRRLAGGGPEIIPDPSMKSRMT